jgi:hypothetical protein
MALQESCEELIAWYTKTCNENLVNLTANIKEVVAQANQQIGVLRRVCDIRMIRGVGLFPSDL